MTICRPGNLEDDNVCWPTEDLQTFIYDVMEYDDIEYMDRKEMIETIRSWMKEKNLPALQASKWSSYWPEIFRCQVFIPDGEGWEDDLSLWNYNINAVLGQYDKANANFKYLGICWLGDKNQYNCKKLIKRINKCKIYRWYAIVLYWEKDLVPNFGAHWSTILLDAKDNIVYHFDSSVDMELLDKYVVKYLEYASKKKGFTTVLVNTAPIQKDKYNCGLFVIDFIINMIEENHNFCELIGIYMYLALEMDKDEYHNIMYERRFKYFK